MGEVVDSQPTIGSNVESVVHKNVRFNVWDLGGQETLRQSWSTYYQGTNAIILVVDSTDTKRLHTAKHELFQILSNEQLRSAVLLVFANKQDCKNKLSAAQVCALCTATHCPLSLHPPLSSPPLQLPGLKLWSCVVIRSRSSSHLRRLKHTRGTYNRAAL